MKTSNFSLDMKAHLKTFPDRRNRSNLVAFLFLTVLFNCFYAKAQNVKNFNTSQPFLFEENKGQLLDESGNVLSDIKYYGKQGGVYVYCKTGMLSFVFTKSEKGPGQISEATGTTEDESVLSPAGGGRGWKNHEGPQTTKISSSRMDLVLLGSNLNTIITASDQQECYENYYTTGDADHGITNVHTYKTLTYKNIYPQIDMILSIAKKGMEYSFLVHPGGNVSDIKLRWNGADKEKALKNGGIKYANMLGIMQESAPKSFVDTKSIQSSFVRKGAQFSFKVENYDRNKDLIIDPTLVWGTYFGGNKADYGYGLATDDSGNVYLLGETTSKSGIASSGAYQTSLAGLGSIFLSKFNSLGNLIWSTYYGGKNNDGALSVAVDKSGNAYITGQASSSSGIATSGAYQTSIAANSSAAFLGKFGSNGQLKWSTYFGNGGEGEEITTDIYGNVIVSGAAYSYKISNSSMVTSGAYETSPGGGNSDAF